MAPRTDAPSRLRARGTISCALMGARRRFTRECRGDGVMGPARGLTPRTPSTRLITDSCIARAATVCARGGTFEAARRRRRPNVCKKHDCLSSGPYRPSESPRPARQSAAAGAPRSTATASPLALLSHRRRRPSAPPRWPPPPRTRPRRARPPQSRPRRARRPRLISFARSSRRPRRRHHQQRRGPEPPRKARPRRPSTPTRPLPARGRASRWRARGRRGCRVVITTHPSGTSSRRCARSGPAPTL